MTRTVATGAGPLEVAVPRDRAGTFAPALLGKGTRRSEGTEAVVTSLYSKGLPVRDISRHLATTMGIEMSHDTVSRITDAALEPMRAWQSRPLEAVYPVVRIDALMARVRDGQSVRNKAVNIAVGARTARASGTCWASGSAPPSGPAAGQALAQLRNRGVEDVIICCCDGLKGLGEEITATWPAATVQTCTVHLIRAATRYADYRDRKALCAIQALGGREPDRCEMDYGHGRIIKRSLWVTTAGDLDFPHAGQVVRIQRDGYDAAGTRISKEIVHAVTSLDAGRAGPAALAGIARGQRGIESVHRIRDIAYREDSDTGYTGNGPQAMATLRNVFVRRANHDYIMWLMSERNNRTVVSYRETEFPSGTAAENRSQSSWNPAVR